MMNIAEECMTLMVKKGEKEAPSRPDYPVQKWAR
jgi:hypothetical protein